jgi:hypothetical protein
MTREEKAFAEKWRNADVSAAPLTFESRVQRSINRNVARLMLNQAGDTESSIHHIWFDGGSTFDVTVTVKRSRT